MTKKRTIPGNLDVYLGTGQGESKEPGSGGTGKKVEDRPVSFGARVRGSVLERLRDAVYWEHTTIGEVVERALERELDRMEKKRGSAYEGRPAPLRTGRPVR